MNCHITHHSGRSFKLLKKGFLICWILPGQKTLFLCVARAAWQVSTCLFYRPETEVQDEDVIEVWQQASGPG
jgi:hypothetical protein